jgi:hypothetical protein
MFWPFFVGHHQADRISYLRQLYNATCSLRRRSSAVRLLRSRVQIPPEAWMFVCCECCVLSGRGLCDGLITRPEESYQLWRVVVCDQEASKTRRLNSATGLWKIQPQWFVTPRKQKQQTNKHTMQYIKDLILHWIVASNRIYNQPDVGLEKKAETCSCS